MLTKAELDFLLKITGYFHGHWQEDKEWGNRPLNQLLILLSTHMLSGGIADPATRASIQGHLGKALVHAAENAVKGAHDPVHPNALDFIVEITDYFHGHWENPEWGKRLLNQLLILLAAHALADGIAEPTVRASIQGNIQKAVIDAAERTSKQGPVPPSR